MSGVERQVQATIERMTAALARGDLEGVTGAYEPAPTIVFERAVPVSDPAEVRRKFTELMGVQPDFRFGRHEVIVAGDIALHIMPWTMTGEIPGGGSVSDAGLSVAVLRRQPDGDWLMVIDHPHGQHVAAAEPV